MGFSNRVNQYQIFMSVSVRTEVWYWQMPDKPSISRRRLLGLIGSASTAGLAGCSGPTETPNSPSTSVQMPADSPLAGTQTRKDSPDPIQSEIQHDTLFITDSHTIPAAGATAPSESYKTILWHHRGVLSIEDGGELKLIESTS